MDYPKLEELNSSNCTERSILKHYPEFWKHIIDNYHHSELWTERLYWFYYKLDDFPKCKKCGKPTKFVNIKTGYREFCSTKCMNSYGDIQKRKKLTSIKNWGTDNPMKSKKVKDKLKKSTKEKYGVENVFELEETKRKIKQTNLNKYGVEYYLSTKECRDKIKRTCLERYGVTHNTQILEVREKMSQKYKISLEKINPNIIGFDGDDLVIKCCDPSCNLCKEKIFNIPRYLHNSRMHHNQELCTIKNQIGLHNKNTSIELFVQNILSEYNFDYQTNIRKLMGDKKEIDIFIPEKNIAIECNGIYWHSEYHKEQLYHISKYKKCYDKNIQLLTIWGDWINTKPEIVKSIILDKLGVNNCNNIYARKCVIKDVKPDICNKFLEQNHIQGGSTSSIRLGLYYNDELVSLMTFSPPRINMGSKDHKQQWELVRFCNKLNTRVIGGASKLLKYFIKIYNPKSIVSFSSNDISNGHLYEILGFETDGSINQSYWYIEPITYKRYHRMTFTKQSIVKRGWKNMVDDTWTEKEVMFEKGYYRIYDSGQKKWVLNLS